MIDPTAPNPLTNGLMIVHGNQPELLRHLLVHWSRSHPLAALEDEVILVQSNGIAQWLKLAMAENVADGGLGIAAGLDLLLPSRFIWRAYRAVLGPAQVPEASPFDKSQLIWRLMRLLPTLGDEADFQPLSGFITEDPDGRKRYQLAEQIADLFDQYQVYRADWLDDWAGGANTWTDPQGHAHALTPEQRWQAQLWRRLLDDVGANAGHNRASIHRRFLAAAEHCLAPPPGLPRRVSVFGVSALPRQSLEVLLALSRFSQILLFVNNPCQHYWADLLSPRQHERQQALRHQRKANAPAVIAEADLHLYAHPLLAAWGQQGRDYLALLDELDQPESYRLQFTRIGESIDLFATHGDDCLLHQLQEDIRLLRSTAEARETWPAVDPKLDHSVRFHIAHSPQREVEILHDQLLAALAADSTLRPRDILVMVPDVNAYAPHIDAVFGQIEAGDERYIPYVIADQATRQRQPLAVAVDWLLRLPESRLAVSELLDLLDIPAVRQRFSIVADDLPRLRRWVEQANIRWGLDGSHRAEITGQTSAQNTWQHGLRRMFLGYATGGDPLGEIDCDWQEIEPYPEIGGLDAALLGPLSQVVDRLADWRRILSESRSPSDWGDCLTRLLDDFLAPDTPADLALLDRIRRHLADWMNACAYARLNEPLPLAVVREHWLGCIDEPTLAQRFLAGRLTFATLMPMRAIPFRRVCLLGMNDGEFPRQRPPADFDLMAGDRRPGDRSRREDDRYLFLEALLSARDHLHISWVGKRLLDNSDCPPSVLVAQLRDHLAAVWRRTDDDAETLLDALTVRHAAQPFNPRYFGQSAPESPWFTYAREWERTAAPPAPQSAVDTPLPAAPIAPIRQRQLVGFLKDPVRTFFTERLGVHFENQATASPDQEPFALDFLESWQRQDEVIAARRVACERGEDERLAVDRQIARIRRRGELPLGASADLLAESISLSLERMFNDYRGPLAQYPNALPDAPVEVALTVDDETLVLQGLLTGRRHGPEGTITLLLQSNDLLAGKAGYRREHLIAAWVNHLLAHAAGQSGDTLVIGKNGSASLPALDPEAARAQLSDLLRLYRAGLREPLPVAPKTALAWLSAKGEVVAGPLAQASASAIKAAAGVYHDGFQTSGEVSRSAYRLRVYPDFPALWAEGRFSQLAQRLYGPLLAGVGSH